MRALFASRDRETARLAATLARLAVTDLPILLEGETGSGKTHVAKAIHRRSRPGRPLVVVDCGALPEALFAAELFGHRAGAFTDATASREGWLSRARAGTLLLERVDAMPSASQVALLRVLEERVFYPIGAATARRFTARVIATADAGAADRRRDGSLRDDLYHRLSGFHAVLRPLRHRPADIVPFARATLARLARAGHAVCALDAEAEALLSAYPWPGNFRELAAVIERAFLERHGAAIDAAGLGLPAVWDEIAALAAERELAAQEVARLYGLYVLARHGGNVSAAARALGVSRRTLIRWRAGR